MNHGADVAGQPIATMWRPRILWNSVIFEITTVNLPPFLVVDIVERLSPRLLHPVYPRVVVAALTRIPRNMTRGLAGHDASPPIRNKPGVYGRRKPHGSKGIRR